MDRRYPSRRASYAVQLQFIAHSITAKGRRKSQNGSVSDSAQGHALFVAASRVEPSKLVRKKNRKKCDDRR